MGRAAITPYTNTSRTPSVLSLTIPQMDAVSLVSKMRAQKQFTKLPICVLADSKTVDRADDALASGANEAFLKDETGAINSVIAAINGLVMPSLARRSRSSEPAMVPRSALASVPAGRGVPVAASVPASVSAPPPVPIANGVSNSRSATAPSSSRVQTLGEIETAYDRASAQTAYNRAPVQPRYDRAPIPEEPEELDSGAVFSSASSHFLDGYGRRAHSLRQDFIRFRTAGEGDRPEHLNAMLNELSTLNVDANASGLTGLSLYLTVIESRVRQLLQSQSPPNPSSLSGLATAVDTLAALNNHVQELLPLNNYDPLALVVDDDPVSRKTLSLGLEKSKIKTTAVDNPDAALLEAESKPFELIFLDVDLPKMNGFALCARIRIIPTHRKTPILFVTSLSDIKSRASSRVAVETISSASPLICTTWGLTPGRF